MARCLKASLPFSVPGFGGSLGFTPPSVALDAKLCCKIANFSFIPGSIVIPFSMPAPVATALAVLEQEVDDINQALEFNVDCPGD